ncbi:MAG: hypothetical protein ACJASR_000942 [Psychroserpens sp.]|jgi:hypothetical protein
MNKLLIIKPSNLLSLTIFSLFILALFKPGQEQGMYEWLIRPAYIVNFSKITTLVSLFFIFLGLTYCLIIGVKKWGLKKDFLILNSIFIFSPFAIYSISIVNGADPVSSGLRILISILISIILAFYFSFVVSTKTQKDIFSVVVTPLLIASVLFVLVNLLMFIFDRLAVISSFGRMYGTTEHPNFLGVISATIVLLLYLVLVTKKRNIKSNLNDLNSKLFNNNFLIVILLSAVMLVLLSGSRTAMSIIAAGLLIDTFCQRRNIGRNLLTLIVMSVVMLIFITYFTQITEVENVRALSTENTREGAWNDLLEDFLNYPLFGIGLSNLGASENSILRALASSGIVGGVFFLIINIVSVRVSFLSIKYVGTNGYEVSPIIIGLLLGSILEGYLLDSLSYPVITFQYMINFAYLSAYYKRQNIN